MITQHVRISTAETAARKLQQGCCCFLVLGYTCCSAVCIVQQLGSGQDKSAAALKSWERYKRVGRGSAQKKQMKRYLYFKPGFLRLCPPPHDMPQQGLDTIARCTLLTKCGQKRMLMIDCRRRVSIRCAGQRLHVGVLPRPFLVHHSNYERVVALPSESLSLA